jgi:hypothetical protein
VGTLPTLQQRLRILQVVLRDEHLEDNFRYKSQWSAEGQRSTIGQRSMEVNGQQ